jgi:hypothetical protein
MESIVYYLYVGWVRFPNKLFLIFSWQGKRFCVLRLRWLWGPPSLIFRVHRVYSAGGKRPGREVYQSLAAGVEVKNEWSCTSIPLICLHGVDRDNFTLLHNDRSVYLLQAGIQSFEISNLQACRHIHCFSIRGLPRPEKIWKLKK